MAVPTYTTDLVLFKDFETTPTYGEFAGYNSGRAPSDDTDYPIQGTTHGSDVLNAVNHGSIAVDYGSTISWTSGWAIFIWQVWTAPGAINTQAGGGMVFIVGNTTTNADAYYVGGKDAGSYPYGGWQNFAVDPEITRSEIIGSGSAGVRWVGPGVDSVVKVAKGAPLGVDVIRYGRGTFRVAGGSSGDGYATFTAMAAYNDDNTRRWGQFQSNQYGFQMKGIMYLGYNALTEHTDSNKGITIENTEFVPEGFNRIEIHNASSIIDWTNITFSSICTVSPGQLEVYDDATVGMIGCSFKNMDTFIFDSNSSITNTTFVGCNTITVGGGTFIKCTFDSTSGTKAVFANTAAEAELVSDSTFISGGTGYGLEVGGTVDDFILSGVTWTGYAIQSGTTTDRAIHILATTGTVTITVSGGTTPSYHSDGATVVISDDVVNSVTIRDSAQVLVESCTVAVYLNSDNSELANEFTTATGKVTFSCPVSSDFTIRARKNSPGETRYFPVTQIGNSGASGVDLSITIVKDVIAN
ncbi:MAG: hypothetical protein J7L15_09670 [Clostridiales bacterium]|nr:hypothetical protein [Clostridiales bacterium]